MIHLHDKNKKKIAGLIDYKDLFIESELQSGEKTLCFYYPKKANYYFDIVEECYIRTKENEYIVKERIVQSEYTEFKCILNLEDIEGKPFSKFESKEQTIDKALALALAGTGWVVGKCELKKKRTVRMTNCSSLEIIQEIKKTYRCDIVFNTLSKTIDVYEHLGEDKGTYFIDSLNLKSLAIQGSSYSYFTRLIPIGKDNLKITDINDKKEYVENYQYSNKIKTVYWIDDRYTVKEHLKDDAISKLNEISKPFRSYSAAILNLAKLNNKYKNILDYKLGDTITLISKEDKFKDKQRIVKIIEFPDEHEKDSVELANTTLCFEDIQIQFQEAADTVENITTDNGTIKGSTIDSIKTEQISDFETSVANITDLTVINAKVSNLEAFNVTISGELTAVKGTIGTLTTNMATIDSLTVTHSAQINNLQANKASITDLHATNATIQVLEANVGNIRTLVNGNLSSENIQVGGITGDRLNMKTIFVDDANIVSINASKINAGEISTNKVKIKSDDGGIEIIGTTLQFKDKNNKVRIQMGKDAKGDFNFIILGDDGTTTLIDHTGVKEKAIANDLIKSNMIASNAVGEKQIDYSSFSEGFNKDTNTHTLNATKIKLNNQNQTLDIAFNSLKKQSDSNKTLTENHSTTIGVMQGQISTAINNTQIVKDGKTVLLKDDYNRTVETVDSLKSTIGKHTTLIDQQTGLITGVTTKVNNFERDLNGMSITVSETKTKLDNLQIGGRNFLINSNFKKGLVHHTVKNSNNPGSINTTTFDGKTCCYFQNIKYWNETKYLTVSQTPYDVEKGYIVSMDIYAINPAPLAIDTTGVIDAEDRSVPATSARKWQRVSVYIPPHSGRNLSGDTGFSIYALKNHTFTGYITNIKVEHGNKPTGWSPAPEDIQEEVNSNISSLDVKLDGIVSRVSSVEANNQNLAGQVSGLSTWKVEAEQKITKAAIISTVNSEFYTKGQTDSRYAAQSQVTQLVNQISSKVDVNGVKSLIQQNPNDIMIGFNGINNRITIDPIRMTFKYSNGKPSMVLQGGALYAYNWLDETFLGGMQPILSKNNTSKGFGFLGSRYCQSFSVNYASGWSNADQTEPTGIQPQLVVNFVDRDVSIVGGTKGIHCYLPIYLTSFLSLAGNNIIGAGKIGTDKLLCTKFYSSSNEKLIMAYDEEINRLSMGADLLLNGFSVLGGGYSSIYGVKTIGTVNANIDNFYSNDGKTYYLSFNNTHRHLDLRANMDVGYHTIQNGYLRNMSMNYSLSATSPGWSVGADVASIETMLLQEDFSTYNEENDTVSVDLGEVIKSIYARNRKLEDEKELLTEENNKLKNVIDEMLMR